MAGAFNLTAQLNLQGPGNIKPVIGKIRQELGQIKTNINLNLNKNAAKSVGDVTNRLRAMNNVLATSKTQVADLNKQFQQLSSSLGAVKGVTTAASSGLSVVNKNAATSAKQIKEAANAMEAFGKQAFLAVKRFAAFSVVTTGIYGLVNAIQSGFTAFIELDRQLIRLQQVTNSGALGIKSLSDEITNLAKNLGVSSASLAEVAVTLAQAGLTARQTKEALAAIAKTDLSPTFDNMTDTTEGAIAAMSQFNIATSELEGTLGRINAVAGAFAVESSDIIKAIQRAGSVFASSSKGVSTNTEALNEFIAVFTAVRSTTRESAETIATGLRTIFTRIQRPQTIEFLRTYGVELTDLEGKFVGPYESARRLSEVLGQLDPRDLRFGQIVEELGGFRQINKVIPILQNFSSAQKALDVARKGSGSLAKDQALAELSLAVQLAKVREEFLGLIKAVGQSKTFQTFFTITTMLTRGLIGLAGAFKPILPALAILGTLKLGKAAIDFGGGFLGSFKKGGGSGAVGTTLGQTITGSKTRDIEATKALSAEVIKANTSALSSLTISVNNLSGSVNDLREEIATSPFGGPTTKSGGGKIMAFARGGVVPGSGNRDTVPAMLQPGEFVIRKKAVEALGTGRLHSMNKYAGGGAAKISDVIEIGDIVDGDTFDAIVTPKTDSFKATFRLAGLDTYEKTKRQSKITRQKYNEIKNFNKNNPKRYSNFPSEDIAEIEDPISIGPLAYVARGGVTAQEQGIAAAKYLEDTLKKDNFTPLDQTDSFGRYLATPKFNIPEEYLTGRFEVDEKAGGGLIQKFMAGGLVGIFDSDKIEGGTKTKKEILELLKKSGKSYDVIHGPAGSGKTTLASQKYGDNFVLSPEDLAKYNEFVVLSGAGPTKTGEFSDDVISLMTGARNITALMPNEERVNQQRQKRVDEAILGNIRDTRSVSQLQATFKAPSSVSKSLFDRFKNVNFLEEYAVGGEVERLAAKFNLGKASQGWWKGKFRDQDILWDMANRRTAYNADDGSAIDISSLPASLKKTWDYQAQTELDEYRKYRSMVRGAAQTPMTQAEKEYGKVVESSVLSATQRMADKKKQQEIEKLAARGGRFTGDYEPTRARQQSKIDRMTPEERKQYYDRKFNRYMAGSIVTDNLDDEISSQELLDLRDVLGSDVASIRGALGGQRALDSIIAEVRKESSWAKPVTSRKLLEKPFIKSDDSIPYRSKIKTLLEQVIEKRTKRVFTDEEKANATKVGLVGMFPFDVDNTHYEDVAGRVLEITTKSIPSSKAERILQMRQEIDEVLGRGTKDLYGRDPLELDDKTKEALGLGNLEGYMIEAILAKAGANPGRLDDRSVDYPTGLGQAAGLFGINPDIPTEVKRDVKGGLSKARTNFANFFKKFFFGGVAESDEDTRKYWETMDAARQKIKERERAEQDKLKGRNYGRISLRKDASNITATYMKDGYERDGFVTAKKYADNLYTIGLSRATKGYGPRLYDVVMEAATSEGRMLTSDREIVSGSAKNVWDYYFKNRSDVRKTPLDPKYWTKNSSLIDPKLYGKPETWPPKDDPAWALQTGYSKSADLINSPEVVDGNKIKQNSAAMALQFFQSGASRFANGGAAQDTVPALLTPGEFVINKKAASKIGHAQLNRLNHADKIQGYNKGGYVGVQRFDRGSYVLPAGAILPGTSDDLPAPNPATTAPAAQAKAQEILADAASRAGKSLQDLERETKQQIAALAQSKKAERVTSRANLKTEAIRTSGRGFADAKDRETFEERTRKDLTNLTGGQFDETQIAAAATALANMTSAGASFTDIMNSTNAVLQPFQEAMNTAQDSAAALYEAQVETADSLGALTEAARLSAEELANIEYAESGQARADFGLAGVLNPENARAIAESTRGGDLLSNARGILGGGKLGGLVTSAVDALPDSIAGPMKEAMDQIGGPSGAIAAGVSLLGQNLPSILSSVGLGDSTLGAGIGGALAEGGSRAVSMATLGTQLAGPIGGAIGLITGAISGAIDGFINATRTKTLEKSMMALDKATQASADALETLSKFDTEANFQDAAKATDVLRDSITDLGAQAGQGGSSALSGMVQGAGYGAIVGAAIGSIIPVIGTAFGAAIGGIIGGVGAGLTSFFSGDDEISEEAFKGQLKAIDSYISGMQQLAERRIKLQPLEDIVQAIDDFNNAKTPEAKAALGQQSVRVQEAQRAALLRSGADIKQSESIQDFIKSGRGGSEAQKTVAAASEDIAVAQAMQELNQLYAGNKEAIDREAADKKKLIARGYELIAEQENQQNQEARLAITMKEVNKQTEGLIEKFRKMDNAIQTFNDNLDMMKTRTESASAAAAGSATSTVDYRADERILSNATDATASQFESTLGRVGELAGGGANADLLTNALRARRSIEGELPEILRGADQNDIQDVEKRLRATLSAGGVSGPALEETIKDITEKLSGETSGRQGKSFQELVEEFPALRASMTGLEEANKTAINLVKANNAAMSEYGNLLDQINEATRRQIDIQARRDQLALEYSQKLEEMTGQRSNIRLDQPLTNKVRRLTTESGIAGGTLDPNRIGEAQRAATRRRGEIEDQIASGQDTQQNRDALAEQTNIVNNLNQALEELANNTETTAQIMKEFQEARKLNQGATDIGQRLLTADPEELFNIGQQQSALSAFQRGDAQMMARLKNPASGAKAAQDIYAGFEMASFGLSEEEKMKQQRALTDQLYEARTGQKFENLVLPNGQTVKETRETEDKKAKELMEEQKRRDEALMNLGLKEEQLKNTYEQETAKLIKSLDDLKRRLDSPLTFQPTTAAGGTAAGGTAADGTGAATSATTEAAARAAEAGAAGAPMSIDPVLVGMSERLRDIRGSIGDRTTGYSSADAQKLYSEVVQLYAQKTGAVPQGIDTLNTQHIGVLLAQLDKMEKLVNDEMAKMPTITEDAVEMTAQATSGGTTPLTQGSSLPPTPLTQGSSLPPSAMFRGMDISQPASAANVLQSLLAGISASNPLPVKVVNVAEFKNANGSGPGNDVPQELPSFFTITDDAKRFLSDFQTHINQFGSYVARLEAKTFPSVIQMQGKHVVDVRVTGAAAFESLKGDFAVFVQEEINKHMREQWNKTGGALGSSGAASRSVGPVQY